VYQCVDSLLLLFGFFEFVVLVCLMICCCFFVVGTSASDCLERLVPEMTCNVSSHSSRMQRSIYSLSRIANGIVLMMIGALLYCEGRSLTVRVSLCTLSKQDNCSFNQSRISGWF